MLNIDIFIIFIILSFILSFFHLWYFYITFFFFNRSFMIKERDSHVLKPPSLNFILSILFYHAGFVYKYFLLRKMLKKKINHLLANLIKII